MAIALPAHRPSTRRHWPLTPTETRSYDELARIRREKAIRRAMVVMGERARRDPGSDNQTVLIATLTALIVTGLVLSGLIPFLVADHIDTVVKGLMEPG